MIFNERKVTKKMLNNITIQGRIVRDPELKTTTNGKEYTTFTIACDRDYGNETDFIDVMCFSQTAVFAHRYFAKGRLILINGRLQNREWTGKDGQKRKSAEIIADHLYFGDSKNAESKTTPEAKPVENPIAEEAPNLVPLADDDELPF